MPLEQSAWDIVAQALPAATREQWCLEAVKNHPWNVNPTSYVFEVRLTIDYDTRRAMVSQDPWLSCPMGEDIVPLINQAEIGPHTVGLLLVDQGAMVVDEHVREAVISLLVLADGSAVESLKYVDTNTSLMANRPTVPAQYNALMSCLWRADRLIDTGA